MDDDENEGLYDNENNDDDDQSSDSESGSQGNPNGSSLRDRASDGINKVKGGKDKARQAGQAVSNALKKIVNGVKIAFKFVISHPIVAICIAVVIIILLGSLWLATEMTELKEAGTKIKDFFSSLDVSSMSPSEKKAKDLYEATGSLIYVTDDQLNKFTDDYLDWIENKNDVKYEALKRKYKNGDTASTFPSGVANINDSEKLYKHILSTEKYNFNRVNWQAYTRYNLLHNDPPSGTLTMKKDDETRLQYPAYIGELGGVSELDFYVEKLFPYLQSWVIPISMMGGTTEGGLSGISDEDEEKSFAADAYSSRFAYELLASGYHRIDFDRYETFMREIIEDYRIYDETITPGIVTRTCTTYTKEVAAPTEDNPDNTVTLTAGPVCVDSDITYGTGVKKSYAEFPNNYSGELSSNFYNIRSYVNDNVGGGYTERAGTGLSVTDLGNTSIYQYDITKFRGFDLKFDKEYLLIPYKLSDQQMGAQEGSTPYTLEKVYSGSIAGGTEYDRKNESPPAGYSPSTTTTSTINVTKLNRDGQTVTVDRTWQDQLSLDKIESGNYSVEDVKKFENLTEITDLSAYEDRVYRDLKDENEINIIDIINAHPEIYKKYLDKDQNISKNIGYSRDYLEVSYYLLKENLIDLAEEYGIAYIWGSTIVPNMPGTIIGTELEGGSLDVKGLKVIFPFTADVVKSNILIELYTRYSDGSYSYTPHSGVDIQAAYALLSKEDKKRCDDLGQTNYSRCAYIRGPKVYSVMDGTLEKVTYSEYNVYYKTGTIVTDPDGPGNLQVASACAVYIRHADGKQTVYYHLYPDKEFFVELATHVGETLPVGTFVGYMGNTGKSSGLHLHFEYGETLWTPGVNGDRTYALLKQGKENTMGNKISTILDQGSGEGEDVVTPGESYAGTLSQKCLYLTFVGFEGLTFNAKNETAYTTGSDHKVTIRPGVTNDTRAEATSLGYEKYYPLKVGDRVPQNVTVAIASKFMQNTANSVLIEAKKYGVTFTQNEIDALTMHKYQTPGSVLVKLGAAYKKKIISEKELFRVWMTYTGNPGNTVGLYKRYLSEFTLFLTGKYTINEGVVGRTKEYSFSSSTPLKDYINGNKTDLINSSVENYFILHSGTDVNVNFNYKNAVEAKANKGLGL